ncbi:hypothetical protein [Mesorhizobium sp. M0227]|uniref:hypothetical protein n=1 Tax=unclassified Mesorhizobium TaxID=325217 RepID=UPI003336C869
MTTSESVVQILVGEGGYRELPRPLKVGSLSFDFAHALVAGDKANDLVIVIELKGDTPDDIVIRKVLSLTRALDVLQSKRSVTAVLTSGQASPETIHSISRVCRVLPVGAPFGPKAVDAVRDWLSVLLPLAQPPPVKTLVDWEGDLRSSIPASAAGPFLEELLRAAPAGKMAVEQMLASAIQAPVESVLEDDQDEQ